jgi:hypothetical protein
MGKLARADRAWGSSQAPGNRRQQRPRPSASRRQGTTTTEFIQFLYISILGSYPRKDEAPLTLTLCELLLEDGEPTLPFSVPSLTPLPVEPTFKTWDVLSISPSGNVASIKPLSSNLPFNMQLAPDTSMFINVVPELGLTSSSTTPPGPAINCSLTAKEVGSAIVQPVNEVSMPSLMS